MRLTPKQYAMLEAVARGHDWITPIPGIAIGGVSAHVRRALIQRGCLDNESWAITDLGRENLVLIHWSSVPSGICERKDQKVDSRTHVEGLTTITWSGEADHPENVTCWTCRKYLNEHR